MATTGTAGTTERAAKGGAGTGTAAAAVEKIRVNVMIPSDVLAALDLDAQRCKLDRSAAIVEAVQARLAGSGRSVALAAPVAPVVVDVPSPDDIVDVLLARVPVLAAETAPRVRATTPASTDTDVVMDALTMIYREVATQREMTKDRIAERYVDHGATIVDGEAAARDAWAVARDKVVTDMTRAPRQ